MDASTVIRSLRILEKRGLLVMESRKGRDKKVIILTPAGDMVLEKAVPLWEQAQNKFVAQLGQKRWRQLFSDLSAAVTAARGIS